jgi:hypothetical protein
LLKLENKKDPVKGLFCFCHSQRIGNPVSNCLDSRSWAGMTINYCSIISTDSIVIGVVGLEFSPD